MQDYPFQITAYQKFDGEYKYLDTEYCGDLSACFVWAQQMRHIAGGFQIFESGGQNFRQIRVPENDGPFIVKDMPISDTKSMW